MRWPKGATQGSVIISGNGEGSQSNQVPYPTGLSFDRHAAEIFSCAPISTATVERDFSTMNRILTGLRNRLTTEHLRKLMRISREGPADLDDDIKNIIIDCWKSKKLRKISV
ncbi:unnamed protein product [Rotaria sp. Silwood1]|nr:unnamed protein product [Rotaria sp. Silwood1]